MILLWYWRWVILAVLITPKSIIINLYHRFTIKANFIPLAIKGINWFQVYLAYKFYVLKRYWINLSFLLKNISEHKKFLDYIRNWSSSSSSNSLIIFLLTITSSQGLMIVCCFYYINVIKATGISRLLNEFFSHI